MRNAMLINEKDNVIVAIEPLSRKETRVYQMNGDQRRYKSAGGFSYVSTKCRVQ